MSGALQAVFQNQRSFISVPDAPTIGVATVTGATTVTVSYTAPANNGGSTITLYTATSSPGSVTGTLAQAGSGTITVSGLTTGTAYTFTVTATNAIGTSAASAASNSVTPTALGYFVTLYGTPNSGGTNAPVTTLDSSGNGYSWIYAPYSGSASSIGIKLTSTASVTFKNQQYTESSRPPSSFALDTSANFYFATQPSGGNRRMGLTKVNSSGTIQWQKAWTDAISDGDRYADTASPVIDSSDNIYTTYTTAVNAACCSFNYRAIVMKVDSSGTGQWRRAITLQNGQVNRVISLALDSSANVYSLVQDNTRAQLIKMDSSGTKLASSQFTRTNSSGGVDAVAMVFDSANSVGYFIAGVTNSSLVFVKFNSSLAFTYAKTLTNVFTASAAGGSIALDSSGNVYVGVNSTTLNECPIIIKYDSSGTIQWQRQLTASSSFGIARTFSIAVSGSTLTISGFYSLADNYGFIFKAPTDGSNTGSFSNNGKTWTYAAYTGSTAGTVAPFDNGTTVAFATITFATATDPAAVPATASSLTTLVTTV